MSQPTPVATVSPTSLDRGRLVAWRNAVMVIFALCGLSLSGWLARTPTVRDLLHASTALMGWLAFGVAVGSILGLTLSSHVLAHLGPRRTMLGCLLGMAVGLTVAGFGASVLQQAPVILAGLALYGMGMGMCDVSMNVDGAATERAMGKSVMPLFHAAFSAGTMLGAGVGALAEHLHVPVFAHMVAVGVVLVVGGAMAVRHLAPHPDAPAEDAAKPGWRDRLSMWTDRRTLLIGLIVLGFAFAEGSANDWLALAMVDGHGTSHSTGGLFLGLFLTAMTLGRILGVRAIDRLGRVVVLRATGALAVLGLLVVIFAGPVWLVALGAVCWGLGASLGFPIGMSAAADDPATAAARVSAVATIGYVAFLVGPPVIGFLGEHVGLLHALLVVLVLVGVAAMCAPAARTPLEASDAR